MHLVNVKDHVQVYEYYPLPRNSVGAAFALVSQHSCKMHFAVLAFPLFFTVCGLLGWSREQGHGGSREARQKGGFNQEMGRSGWGYPGKTGMRIHSQCNIGYNPRNAAVLVQGSNYYKAKNAKLDCYC